MKYNKLIRDKIPEIIVKDGKKHKTHIAGNDEYWQMLKEKLKEEVEEFCKDENITELADIHEVLLAISKFKNINIKDIENVRKERAEKRGAFQDKIILDEVLEES